MFSCCFDEIHKYREWSKELKSITDSFPGLRIIASGSSVLSIWRGSHDLSRRAVLRQLSPMSFREWLTVRGLGHFQTVSVSELVSCHRTVAGHIVQQLRDAGTTVLSEFGRYLKTGYYPYAFEHENALADFLLTLEQSVHATIETDLPALFPSLTGASIQKIKQLLSIISGLVPFKPDMAGLKRSLQIGDERTLKTYLKHLEDAGIVRCLHRQGKTLNNLDKPEKLYLDNPNLMLALTGESGIDMGNMRETFLLSCFRSENVLAPARGDFQVGRYVFEVGGKNKSVKQSANQPDSYLALDQLEIGMGNKIPLWLFGFLY
ncbi:MAG TPA: 3-dehydroquinate dehydratase [Verrucomicrobia bacterium]|nr:3-dehydroquinate dehydratase [Verrucomicrobiota bacterium]